MAEDFTERATCECYYKFENAGDLGEDNQNQIDLTNNNAVTQDADIPSGTYAGPSAAKSADFEAGSTQYLSATHDASTEVDDLTALTALTWVKFESEVADFALLDHSKYGADGWYLYVRQTLERIATRYDDTSYTEDAPSFSTAVWYFIALTYDHVQDEQRVYVGTEEGQVALSGTPEATVDKTAATTTIFTLGRRASNADYYLDALMCELAVFSESLTLAELQEIQADGMEGSVAVAPTGNISGPLHGPLGGPI